jgi:TPR repeat protein
MHARRGTTPPVLIVIPVVMLAVACARDGAAPTTTPPRAAGPCPDGPTCTTEGDRLATGDGVARDPAAAVALYTVGCDLGHGPACGALARHVLIGRGVAQDTARGVALLDQACTAGDPPACLALAGAFGGFHGTTPDPARAQAARDRHWMLLEAACDQGDVTACRDVAFSYDIGFDDDGHDDPARALELYTRACDLGDSFGCSEVADQLRRSDVPADQARAKALGAQVASGYQSECDAGNARSCMHLRRLYVLGQWVPMDPDRVDQLGLQGCEAGDVVACDYEASAFREGSGGRAANATRAAGLTERGRQHLAARCDRGEADACVSLAFRSPRGTGYFAEADAAQLALLERACEEGAPDGCTAAAHAYRRGNGTAVDEARAAALEARACTLAKACPPR